MGITNYSKTLYLSVIMSLKLCRQYEIRNIRIDCLCPYTLMVILGLYEENYRIY